MNNSQQKAVKLIISHFSDHEVVYDSSKCVPENILQMALFCRRAEQTSKIQGGRSWMYLSRSSAIEELCVSADPDIDCSPTPLPPQHPESTESTTINTLWAGGVKDMRGSNTALKKNEKEFKIY